MRLADPASGRLVARAVVSLSPALAAELEGSSVPAGVQEGEIADVATLPPALRRAAERAGVDAALVVAITAGDDRIGTVELLRKGAAFSEADHVLARVAATQAALVAGGDAREPSRGEAGLLDTAGEALAAGAEGSRVEPAVVRLAMPLLPFFGSAYCSIRMYDVSYFMASVDPSRRTPSSPRQPA